MKYEKLDNKNSNKKLSLYENLTFENEIKSKIEVRNSSKNTETGILKKDEISENFVETLNVDNARKISLIIIVHFCVLTFVLLLLMNYFFLYSDTYFMRTYIRLFVYLLILIYSILTFYDYKRYKKFKNTKFRSESQYLVFLEFYIIYYVTIEFLAFFDILKFCNKNK